MPNGTLGDMGAFLAVLAVCMTSIFVIALVAVTLAFKWSLPQRTPQPVPQWVPAEGGIANPVTSSFVAEPSTLGPRRILFGTDGAVVPPHSVLDTVSPQALADAIAGPDDDDGWKVHLDLRKPNGVG